MKKCEACGESLQWTGETMCKACRFAKAAGPEVAAARAREILEGPIRWFCDGCGYEVDSKSMCTKCGRTGGWLIDGPPDEPAEDSAPTKPLEFGRHPQVKVTFDGVELGPGMPACDEYCSDICPQRDKGNSMKSKEMIVKSIGELSAAELRDELYRRNAEVQAAWMERDELTRQLANEKASNADHDAAILCGLAGRVASGLVQRRTASTAVQVGEIISGSGGEPSYKLDSEGRMAVARDAVAMALLLLGESERVIEETLRRDKTE